MIRAVAFLSILGAAFAQQIPTVLNPPPGATTTQTQADMEQKELAEAVQNANNSSVDLIHLLEAFLLRHPNALQRREVENALAHASIDAKDDRRTILYGEKLLASSPEDLLALDRVSKSLLNLGGRDNAEASLRYSLRFANLIMKAPPVDGRDAAHKQDERERALARALMFQSRARAILGEKESAESIAAKAFETYPAEDSARAWADTLFDLGRAADSIEKLADAFAISDVHAVDGDREEIRKLLGERYRKLHGSETGLGDVILTAYDRTTAMIEARKARLKLMDPNVSESDPLRFTLNGIDGSKLTLGSLKGSVVILDFWATWCGPCRAQHPLYESVKERFKDRKDVVFLAIDADEDHSLVAPFLKGMNWTGRFYFEDGLQKLLGVGHIPTTVVFDKQGRVSSKRVGFLPEKFVDQLSDRIRSALND